MGAKYTSQSASGYNASPPSDDGTVSASNQVFWGADVLNKVGGPLKTFIEAVNTALVNFTNFGSSAISGAYATVASDHMTTLEATGSITISLMDANTAGAGYIVNVKNVGSGTVTVSLVTNTDTLDGTANGTLTIPPQGSRTLKTTTGANGYNVTSYYARPQDIIPSGTLSDFAGTSAPTGWLLCDGTSYLRTDYADLFTAIGTTWGSADGTHFNVPDFRRRVTVGSGGSGTATLANTVGSTGGEETHTLTTPEIPSHTHPPLSPGTSFLENAGSSSLATGSPTPGQTNAATTGATGGGGAHNNMQPSAVVLKIIKT